MSARPGDYDYPTPATRHVPTRPSKTTRCTWAYATARCDEPATHIVLTVQTDEWGSGKRRLVEHLCDEHDSALHERADELDLTVQSDLPQPA